MAAKSATPTIDPTAAPIDGRRQRSQDSRRRIVTAMLELVEAGDLSPSGEQVAAQAKVGLRSVFRHFHDIDSLYLEIGAIVTPRLQALGQVPFRSTAWRDQVAELVPRRAAAYEAMAPILRAMHVHSHRSATVRAGRVRLSDALRGLIQLRIPPGALEQNGLEALDLLLSFESWSRLRHEQGLSVDAAQALLSQLVKAVLAGGRPGE